MRKAGQDLVPGGGQATCFEVAPHCLSDFGVLLHDCASFIRPVAGAGEVVDCGSDGVEACRKRNQQPSDARMGRAFSKVHSEDDPLRFDLPFERLPFIGSVAVNRTANAPKQNHRVDRHLAPIGDGIVMSALFLSGRTAGAALINYNRHGRRGYYRDDRAYGLHPRGPVNVLAVREPQQGQATAYYSGVGDCEDGEGPWFHRSVTAQVEVAVHSGAVIAEATASLPPQSEGAL